MRYQLAARIYVAVVWIKGADKSMEKLGDAFLRQEASHPLRVNGVVPPTSTVRTYTPSYHQRSTSIKKST